MKRYIRSANIECATINDRVSRNLYNTISEALNNPTLDYTTPYYVYLGTYYGDIYGAVFSWIGDKLYGKVACTPNIDGLPALYDNWEFPIDENGDYINTEIVINKNNVDSCVKRLLEYWQPYYDRILEQF